MAKGGRLFVPVDVNWYDEWGHRVTSDAAVLWVIAITTAKRMRSDGSLTKSQLRRVAPTGMSDEMFEDCLLQLCDADVVYRGESGAIIGGESGASRGRVGAMESDANDAKNDASDVHLTGWSSWNDVASDYADASDGGTFGNHIRWHVNTKKPSNNCGFCLSGENVSGRVGGESGRSSGGDHRPDSKSRVEKSREESIDQTPQKPPSPRYENDFDDCWKIYPKKVARKAALKAYAARRNAGVDRDTLLNATKNFVAAMSREGREQEHIMQPSTFYGPHDRWEDYVKAPPKEQIPQGAAPLRKEDYASELGEMVVLPGEAQ